MLNVFFEKYNQYISDDNLRNMVSIKTINHNELSHEFKEKKISVQLIEKVLGTYFRFAHNKEETHYFISTYLERLFINSGKFEFNDIPDLINVFAAKSNRCNLITGDTNIVRLFPETAIKSK